MVGTGGLLVLLVVVSGSLISTALAVFAHRNAEVPASIEFGNLQATVALWGLFEAVIYLLPTTWGWIDAVYTVRFILSALAAVLSIVFIAEYTQSTLLNRRSVRRLLWGGFAAGMGLWLLNPAGLAYEELVVSSFHGITVVTPTFGVGMYLYFLFIYGFLVVVYVVLGAFLLDSTNVYRQQTALIGFAFLVVTVGTIGVPLAFAPGDGLDLGPALNAFAGVVIAIAIYRYEFLSVLPLAKESILDTMADPVFVRDEQGRLIYSNRAAAALEIAGDGDVADRLVADVEAALAGDDVFRLPVDRDDSVTNSGRVFEPEAEGIVDQHGIERGRVIVLRDVTQRYRREQRLEKFASIVSHDLRNPLNVATGRLEMARAECDSDYLDEVARAHERIGELVDDVLTMARVGNELGETSAVDLRELATSCWQSIETADAELHCDTSRTVRADESRLRQLLDNLFRNAVEHGGKDVIVTVGDLEGGFYVEDDGPGIGEEEREAVFVEGYSSAEEGTGLGLNIVRGIVDAHDWTVDVTEGTAGGARVEITGVSTP